MAKVAKLGHVVLYVRDPAASSAWYQAVLGMVEVVANPHIPAVFLSFGTRDHDLALFGVGDGRRLGDQDLNHVSFEFEGDLAAYKAFHAGLLEKGVRIVSSVDHGISYGSYFLDPDGHVLEVFWPRITPDAEALRRFPEVGVIARPVDVAGLEE